MFSADAASGVFDELHDKRFNNSLKFLLEVDISITLQSDVKVQISVTNMPKSGSDYLLFFFSRKLSRLSD